MIEYRDEDHTYWNNGAQVPSVTQILSALNIIDTTWYKDADAQRGKDIHKVIELYEKGTLDWGTVHEDYLGYLEAYQDFRTEMNWDYHEGETAVHHPLYNYAGRLDCVFVASMPTITDIKTGQKQPWHQLQLTAYGLAYPEGNTDLCGLYLSKDGRYDVVEYEYIISDWEAILRAYKWTK